MVEFAIKLGNYRENCKLANVRWCLNSNRHSERRLCEAKNLLCNKEWRCFVIAQHDETETLVNVKVPRSLLSKSILSILLPKIVL